jgi:hypothetical protein
MQWCSDLLNYIRYTEQEDWLDKAIKNIKESNNYGAYEAMCILESTEIEIKDMSEFTSDIYDEYCLQTTSYIDLLENSYGLFIYPNKIFIDTTQSDNIIAETLVHELKHYANRDLNLSDFDDEFSARELEARFSNKYITRGFSCCITDYINRFY